MESGNRRWQYLIVCAVSTAAVTVGVLFSWATPVIPKITNNEAGLSITKAEISWMVAISSIGFVVGSFTARTTSDRFGRRFTILGSFLPITLGTILVTFAWEVWMLSTGRFLWGCGTGMVGSGSLLYIAEIADKDIRGRLSLANRFMLSFGCLLVISVGAFVSYNTLNYMVLALPTLSFPACWWIPESPYYLLKEGKVDAARKTLQMLSGIRDEDVLDEKLSQMQSHVRTDMSRSSSFKEFITGKRYRKAIYIVAGIKIPQLFSGIRPIQTYLAAILLESNSGINMTTALIVFGAVRFILGIMTSALVDRVGRRPLLIYSFFGTGVSLAISAVYFGVQERYGASYPYSLIPFISIIIAVIISVLGYESVAYLVPTELFPMNVKTSAMSMVSVSGGLINFLSVKSYQQTKDLVGLFGVFTLYSFSSFIGAGLSYFLFFETKNKSLKEIQMELQGNVYEEEEKLNTVSKPDQTENGDKDVHKVLSH